ncbi:hypothetical protein [Flavobacterium sp. HNIBRBA15423]|uniref:hypothetical protein n=1 Tax=Flavobacterium sp. HNIBRBA15423 TaxID=3458683 RepID=UPI004044EE80
MSYGTCTMCGCTDKNGSQCIEKSGQECYYLKSSMCSDELVNSDSNGSRIPVNELMNFTKEELEFTKSFISMMESFRDLVKRASPNWSSYDQTLVQIRNTDLWIDAHIKNHPTLQEFRTVVLEEMKELKIEKWPDSIYATGNHFKQR